MQLLIPTPNSLVDVGFNRDRLVLNPNMKSIDSLRHFKFLGILMGVAIRTKKPLNLHLAPTVWKELAGIRLNIDDVEEVGEWFTFERN